MMRSVIAVSISCVITMISLLIMIVEGAITPEAWALLLITPIPVAVSITAYNDPKDVASDSMEDWNEGNEDQTDGNVGDPAEAGFDIPVL